MYSIDHQFVSTSNPESWKQSKIVVAVAHLLWFLLYDDVWCVGRTSEPRKKTWLVGLYRGWKTAQLYGDYFINHYKDPYSTTRIQWKVRFFSWLKCIHIITWWLPTLILQEALSALLVPQGLTTAAVVQMTSLLGNLYNIDFCLHKYMMLTYAH